MNFLCVSTLVAEKAINVTFTVRIKMTVSFLKVFKRLYILSLLSWYELKPGSCLEAFLFKCAVRTYHLLTSCWHFGDFRALLEHISPDGSVLKVDPSRFVDGLQEEFDTERSQGWKLTSGACPISGWIRLKELHVLGWHQEFSFRYVKSAKDEGPVRA